MDSENTILAVGQRKVQIGIVSVLKQPLKKPGQMIFRKGDKQVIESKIILVAASALANVPTMALGYDIKITAHYLELF
ncbi:MAG: hypothetical protein DYG99_07485 [Bacteroidetes bacterium CHB5]|nr:hypothetical protein [Bacteroidetes bacterium CHB5]